jgi:hypothetical protein
VASRESAPIDRHMTGRKIRTHRRASQSHRGAMSASRVCIFGKPLPIRKRLANRRGSARHSDRFMSALCADHRQSQPITRSRGPACSNRVALDLTASQLSPDL